MTIPGTDPATGQDHIDVAVMRDVAVLTLDRPDKLNALTVAMRLRLAALVRDLGTGETVRGIVLTGRGRAFSAGEDLK
ncbi:enoyl-CoA hydratase/isomerase family protein, partial [Nocardioides sp. NPDC057772]|uniref:enoyl-CoA hydratase/isomerase family protein n=1 Tax=Nocardioides sp. NPDC057772 TaxID=3346245 RepID=UPI00366AF601